MKNTTSYNNEEHSPRRRLNKHWHLYHSIIEYYNKTIVGQDHVKVFMADILSKIHQDFGSNKGKPLNTIFFKGPTGVGKTEFVKQTANLLFGDPLWFTMINCEQLRQDHEGSATLFWSPKGYVGYGEPPLLDPQFIYSPWIHSERTHKLHPIAQKKTYMNIILFDEVEKMHPKTIQSLLSMLDEGFVVLKNNETLDCRNSLIFFTSNVGESDAQQVATTVGFGNQNHTTKEKQQSIKEKIFEETFSPEFRGRLDNIIEFEPLEKNFLDILLNKYKKDLIDDVLYLSGNKLLIEYDEQINDHIKNQIQEDKGYRDVHRIRQNLVQNELGSVIKIEKLLREKKHQILHVLVENNELIYELEQKKSLNHPTTKDDTTLIDLTKKDDDHPNNPRPDQ